MTNKRTKNKTKQNGFALLDVLLAMVVLFAVTAFTLQANLAKNVIKVIENNANQSFSEMTQIVEAAGAYRLDEGNWADSVNTCAGAINILLNATPVAYLRFVRAQSPYLTNYITSCDANSFSVSVDTTEVDTALVLSNKIPNGTVSGSIVTYSVPRSSINPTLADFLKLTGGTMSGDINMGNNAITNVSDIELDGKDIKLGIGKFVSMGSDAFNTLNALVIKPNCAQGGGVVGIPKIILRIHGVRTTLGPSIGIRDVSWSARFNSINATHWRLATTGLSVITGVAETFCDYGSWNR